MSRAFSGMGFGDIEVVCHLYNGLILPCILVVYGRGSTPMVPYTKALQGLTLIQRPYTAVYIAGISIHDSPYLKMPLTLGWLRRGTPGISAFGIPWRR